MATLRELMIEIGIDADTSGLSQFERGLQRVMGIAKAVGVALVGAGAAIFALAKSTANYADTIEDTAMAVGLTNKELQTLGHAAQLSGSSLQEAADSMRFLSRNIAESLEGTGPAADAFEFMGLSAKDAAGNLRPTNDVMLDIAEKFAQMDNGARKTQLAMDLFGRSGAKMIPMLNAGRSGIEAMRQEASDLGIVLSDEAIRAGSDFNDAVDRLLAVFNGLKNAIGAAVIPALMELVDGLREVTVANMDVIKSGLSRFITGLIRVIQNVSTFVSFLASGFSRLASVVGGIIPLLQTVGILLASYFVGRAAQGVFDMVVGFTKMAQAIKLVNLQALLIPALIGGAILLAIAVIDDFIAFTEGRDSVLGFLIKNKDEILESIAEAFDSVVEWIDGAFNALFGLMERGTAAFFEFFGVPGKEAQRAASTVVGVFRWMYEGVREALSSLGSFIADTFGFVVDSMRPIVADIVSILNEPMLFFTRFPSVIEGVFETAFGVVSRFVTFAIGGLMDLVGAPKNVIEQVTGWIQNAFDMLGQGLGVAVRAVTEAITDSMASIKDILDFSVGGIASLINFFGGDSPGGNTQPGAQGIAQGVSNNVRNQTANASTTVSPTINVTVQGGDGSGNAVGEDIARRIREEITGVAQGIGRSVEPQFAQ